MVGVPLPPPPMALRSTPPLNFRIGSAVPWNVMTGIGRLGWQPACIVMPATGATAAKRSARTQVRNELMMAPYESPVA